MKAIILIFCTKRILTRRDCAREAATHTQEGVHICDWLDIRNSWALTSLPVFIYEPRARGDCWVSLLKIKRCSFNPHKIHIMIPYLTCTQKDEASSAECHGAATDAVPHQRGLVWTELLSRALNDYHNVMYVSCCFVSVLQEFLTALQTVCVSRINMDHKGHHAFYILGGFTHIFASTFVQFVYKQVCRISYYRVVFAMHPWVYLQLPLDCFDAEEDFKTWWFSGKLWCYMISKQVYGHLFMMDIRDNVILGTC